MNVKNNNQLEFIKKNVYDNICVFCDNYFPEKFKVYGYDVILPCNYAEYNDSSIYYGCKEFKLSDDTVNIIKYCKEMTDEEFNNIMPT